MVFISMKVNIVKCWFPLPQPIPIIDKVHINDNILNVITVMHIIIRLAETMILPMQVTRFHLSLHRQTPNACLCIYTSEVFGGTQSHRSLSDIFVVLLSTIFVGTWAAICWEEWWSVQSQRIVIILLVHCTWCCKKICNDSKQ